jgi:hypothetical protein
VSNELSKQKHIELDGFESYDDSVEGHDRPPSNQGSILKFTNEARWVTREGEEMPPTKELIAIDIAREVVKWTTDKQAPPARTILEPGQRLPDIEKLNAETPQSEWIETPDGRMRGPYEVQHVVYLLDPVSTTRYRYPTSTVGGHIAVRDLVERTRRMRKERGENVYPVINLSDVYMPTRGGRQRPHLAIQRWIASEAANALPPTPAPAPVGLTETTTEATTRKLDAFATGRPGNVPGTDIAPEKLAEKVAEKALEKPQQSSGVQTIEPPTHAEEMADCIPF